MSLCYSATTFVVIFLGGSVVKHLGWRIGALATPGTHQKRTTWIETGKYDLEGNTIYYRHTTHFSNV
jgi:hypothetical protein